MVGFRGFRAELVVGSNAGFSQGRQSHGMRYNGVSWMSPSWGQLERDHSEGQSMVRQARQGTATARLSLKALGMDQADCRNALGMDKADC